MIGFLEVRPEPHETLYPHRIARHFESNIFYTRLGGNDRADDVLAECSGNKWISDTAEALSIAERIGEKTIIIGCSTGATIAWWISQQFTRTDEFVL